MVSIDGRSQVARVCCIGAGYVGGPTSAVMALKCPGIQFTVVDTDAKRISAWNSEELPVYEPGLGKIVRELRGINLHFSTAADAGIRDADIVMIAVNTPPVQQNGAGMGAAADLRSVEECARQIARVAQRHTIVVEKSTVPCRTGELLADILRQNARPGVTFDVLSNPEFLSEGTAIRDLLEPDRVIIGGLDGSQEAQSALSSVYSQWVPAERIVTMGLWSAELAKLASNALLAQRVSSINSISAVCEAIGADVTEVAHGCGMDSRIGSQFLRASVGFGGSCFHKDIQSLVWLSESLGLHDVAEYWGHVLTINESQISRFAQRIVRSVNGGCLQGLRIAVLGFAYKGGTSDTRNTPAARICQYLLDKGADLSIYDPKVPRLHIEELISPGPAQNQARVSICDDPYSATVDARATVVLTAWPQFRDIDWNKIYISMAQPAHVFDGHIMLDRPALEQIGFHVTSVGVRDNHGPA